MGYGQWLELKLVNRTDRKLTVKDLYFHWGRLYEYPEKGKEASLDTVNDHTIEAGDSLSFATCGRESASSGTEGDFNLYDGSTHVMKVYWDCPYWGSNKFATYYVKEGWFPSNTPWSTSEQLGQITVTIFKS